MIGAVFVAINTSYKGKLLEHVIETRAPQRWSAIQIWPTASWSCRKHLTFRTVFTTPEKTQRDAPGFAAAGFDRRSWNSASERRAGSLAACPGSEAMDTSVCLLHLRNHGPVQRCDVELSASAHDGVRMHSRHGCKRPMADQSHAFPCGRHAFRRWRVFQGLIDRAARQLRNEQLPAKEPRAWSDGVCPARRNGKFSPPPAAERWRSRPSSATSDDPSAQRRLASVPGTFRLRRQDSLQHQRDFLPHQVGR